MINAIVSEAMKKAMDRWPADPDQLRTIIAEAVLAERERCARVADLSAAWGSVTAKRIAADIRRGTS